MYKYLYGVYLKFLGSQLRLLNGTSTDNVKYSEAIDSKHKKLVGTPFQFEQDGYSFHLPPPIDTPNSQTIWLAAVAFILGINIGGAYIVYNSKIKKTVVDPKHSGRSKRKHIFFSISHWFLLGFLRLLFCFVLFYCSCLFICFLITFLFT